MEKVREWVTRTMSWNSQNFTVLFDKASTTFISTVEFLTFLKFTFVSMKVHGPFPVHRKVYRIYSHLNFSARREESVFEALTFESADAFQKFDCLFGKYSRYGCVPIQKPSVGKVCAWNITIVSVQWTMDCRSATQFSREEMFSILDWI